MFHRSGFSIAMGNALDDVKVAANQVTRSNDDEGFAYAVENFILNLEN
jgi:hydroxymethylpyrimidine pyrophosphatase-like HAD family hydrolase